MRSTRISLVSMMAAVVLAVSGGAAEAALPEQPRTMAALGDSITRGHNACGWFFDCVDRSWSSGNSDRVESHLRRIAASHPDLLSNVYNNARHGATSADLARQAEQAVEQEAEYVTVLVGAGDVCAASEADMTPPDEFGANIAAGLDALAEAGAQVFVASVPDVIRLWQIGHHSVDVRNTWELGGICPAALSRPDSTDPADRERRDRVAERLDAYNVELATACAGYAGTCVYDGGAVHDHPFTLDHISAWDYFHPNLLGQATLADVTWRSMQHS